MMLVYEVFLIGEGGTSGKEKVEFNSTVFIMIIANFNERLGLDASKFYIIAM